MSPSPGGWQRLMMVLTKPYAIATMVPLSGARSPDNSHAAI